MGSLGKRRSEAAAWLIIAALAAFAAYSATREQTEGGAAVVVDKFNELRGKFVLYLKSMAGRPGAPAVPGIAENMDTLLDQMWADSVTPEDRFHVAIVAGEAKGSESALERLDDLPDRPLSPELTEDVDAVRRIYMHGVSSLAEEARGRLLDRHDFFGRVVLSFNVPSGEEPRKTLQEAIGRFAVIVTLVTLAGLLLGALALVAFGVAIVLGVKGRIQTTYRPDPSVGGVFLEGFALYMLLFFLFAGVLRQYLNLEGLGWEWLAAIIIPIVMAWTRWRGATAGQRRRAFGWHGGQGWYKEVAAGIGGYLAGLPVVAVGIFLTWILVTFTGVQPGHPIFRLLDGGVWQVVALYGLACIWAPVMEETMFRGALFHHIRGRWGWLASAATVSFIFAILHPQGWAAVPALGAIAMVLAGLREWRGSILAPMTAHACNNFVVLTLSLLLLR